MRQRDPVSPGGAYHGAYHEALAYRDDDEYRERVAEFVRPALSAGQPVLALVPPDRMSLVRAAAGGSADQLTVEDMTKVGANPARIIPWVAHFFGAHPGSGTFVGQCEGPLPQPPLAPPPAGVPAHPVSLAGLAQLRRLAAERARAAGARGDEIDAIVLAVSEAAANSIRHASGSALLRCWQEPDSIIFEVADDGHIGDPLAGRHHPPVDATGERGLWLINQLCHLTQLRSDDHGTRIRMVLRPRG